MNLLPQPSGNRPRLACEITPQGVVAARTEASATTLSAVARVTLAAGAVAPSLKPGNVVDRVAVTAALRKALDDLGARSNSRGSDLTLIIPDSAVRVLLLDFDSLPSKLSESLPIVRFRLKKLLPFDADDAMVSYQVMSTSKQMVRVLAVAIPRDVLAEYETVAREAGFEPGAVLPSTLACVAAMEDAESAALLVNANSAGITTAIVRGGILMLHRSVDLQPAVAGLPANLPPALFENDHRMLPLVDAESTAGEWAAQEPLPEHGRTPYADRVFAETAVQDEDSISSLQATRAFELPQGTPAAHRSEPAPVQRSPYASPAVLEDFNAETHNALLISPTSMRAFAEEAVHNPQLASPSQASAFDQAYGNAPHSFTAQSDTDRDISEAVNVAAAYFEDTLATAPSRILCAGPMGADKLQKILSHSGVAQTDGLQVRELIGADALLSSAVTSAVPRGWLAAVAGALRS